MKAARMKEAWRLATSLATTKAAEVSKLLRRGAYAEAEELLSGLIHDIESRSGDRAPELINPLYQYARAVSQQYPWTTLPHRERAALERALRLAVEHHGEESRLAARIQSVLALSLSSCGEAALACTHMMNVVRFTERAHGDGVLLAHALGGLADMLLDAGRWEEALATYERASCMMRGRGDELAEFTLLFGKGRCLIAMGRHPDAVPVLERAYTWFLGRFGDNRRAKELLAWLDRARPGAAGALET
ncbi:tetratricopeptide repeat protein [Sorangium sp. So ce281]|uniref:tetratricopeptide repeat protein n=1 Tax=unclassified Sorangium TaxID=2621164 RepID=UPI003F61E45A